MRKITKKLMLVCCTVFLLLLAAVPVMAAETTTSTAAGWVKVETGYKWRKADGTYYTKTGWRTLGGKQYYLKTGGVMRTGWITSGGKKYYLSNSTDLSIRGTKLTGKKKISGKYYYFSPVKDTLGQMKTGVVKTGGNYYYFDANNGGAMVVNTWKSSYYYGSNGARLTGLNTINKKLYYLGGTNGKKVVNKYGIKIGTAYYKIDKNGVCTKLSTVNGLTGVQLEKIGMGTDKEKNLKKAFDWCTSNIRYRDVAEPSASANKAQYYALFGLKTKPGYGDCNVQAAIFYYMAKALGYSDMTFVQGQVPQANGKLGAHAWCEMKTGTQIWFYDPNAAQSGKTGYHFLYGTPNSYVYKDSHSHVVQYVK